MIIASWNINSIRIRLESIINWLKKRNPDIILFQEIKCQNSDFPESFFLENGYRSFINGQKGRNGVAILVKENLSSKNNYIKIENFLEENQARLIGIYIEKKDLYVYSLYIPNGNPVNDYKKFNYKIEWLKMLKTYIKPFIKNEKNLLLGGDFNVLENVTDTSNFERWRSDALGDIRIRKIFREILSQGMSNIIRIFEKNEKNFSYWDYQNACWERNDGLLIDHFLGSPVLTDKVRSFGIDSYVRGWQRPSDHVPIWVEID